MALIKLDESLTPPITITMKEAKTPSASPPPPKPKTALKPQVKVVKKSAIEEFLTVSHLKLTEQHEPIDIAGVKYLVSEIADSLPHTLEFMHQLRTASSRQKKEFAFELKNRTPEERTAVQKLAETFRLCGIFAEFNMNNTGITGTMSECSRTINFINGGWLELLCQKMTMQIVKEYAEKHQLHFEVLANIVVWSETNMEHHEIDMMFSIGDKVFGLEQKSGMKFGGYDKYRKILEWMGLNSERFLLLNSSLQNADIAECIQYFYQFYVANIKDYEKVLKQMIESAFH